MVEKTTLLEVRNNQNLMGKGKIWTNFVDLNEEGN